MKGRTKKIYLVGGAVRDTLMGRPANDLDLLAEGFGKDELVAALGEPHGKAFPVWAVGPFEIAAARREKKVGAGHKGFAVEWGDHITAAQELARRDFTLNAVAVLIWQGDSWPGVDVLKAAADAALKRLASGNLDGLLDPFGGVADLKAGVLRATSQDTFKDDPLRVLRLARFAARWPWMTVDPATLDAARAAAVELPHLPAERVWMEWVKAAKTTRPDRFFLVLRQAGALPYLPGFDWLAQADGLDQRNHVEDLFAHSLRALRAARRLLGPDPDLLAAALWHDRGKLVAGHDHDRVGADLALDDLKKLKAPARTQRLVAAWTLNHMAVWGTRKPGKLLKLAKALHDAGIDPDTATKLAAADSLGKLGDRRGDSGKLADMKRRLSLALDAHRAVRGNHPALSGLSGPDLGKKLHSLRAKWLADRLTP